MSKRRSSLQPEPLPAPGLLELGQQVGKPLDADGRELQAAVIALLKGVDLETDYDYRIAAAEARAERAERLLALLEEEREAQIADRAERTAEQLLDLLALAASEPLGSA